MEYGSNKFINLFAQRSNLFKPKFWRMLYDITKFNRVSKSHLKNKTLNEKVCLNDYLRDLQLGDWFADYYLMPMGAAIWSTPTKEMYKFPALTFIHFFHNHGLLDIHQPIQWYTVKGGSHIYVKKITQALEKAKVRFFPGAVHVLRKEKIYVIDTENRSEIYDKIIFATHSDQALSLLENPTNQEQQLLSAIAYQKNKIILHKDENFMPKRKNAWSSWVYLADKNKTGQDISLTYWMNSLQPLNTEKNYFVTLNPTQRPGEHLIMDEYEFEHPLFGETTVAAQKGIEKIQGDNNTYFCGAYLRYGFHEDGLLSAVNVAKNLHAEIPW
jgi:predicted NAD/FAD-binding protein